MTPYDERDESSGKFTPEFRDRDFLRALENNSMTTSEVADAVGCEYRTAYARLRDLIDEGHVSSREIGNSLLWRAVIDPPVGTTDESTDQGPTKHSEQEAGNTTDKLTAAVERASEGWQDTEKRMTARKAAARAVLEYAREHGTISKTEAQEEVYPEYPVPDQSARTWYRKNARPALNEAAEYDATAKAYRLQLE